MLQQPPGQPHTYRHPRIPEFCQDATCLFLIHRGTHSPPPQEVSHQSHEATGSRTKTCYNLRHLAPREKYTSLQYYWLVGKSSICKFVPQVCRAILAEFPDQYLCCPESPEECKSLRGRAEPDGMVPAL